METTIPDGAKGILRICPNVNMTPEGLTEILSTLAEAIQLALDDSIGAGEDTVLFATKAQVTDSASYWYNPDSTIVSFGLAPRTVPRQQWEIEKAPEGYVRVPVG